MLVTVHNNVYCFSYYTFTLTIKRSLGEPSRINAFIPRKVLKQSQLEVQQLRLKEKLTILPVIKLKNCSFWKGTEPLHETHYPNVYAFK